MSITATRRVTATRQFSTGTEWVGRRLSKACTRCGRPRQVNSGRARTADLCADCRTTDPNVWNREAWDPTVEGDDDE